jgi:hypothetical protein
MTTRLDIMVADAKAQIMAEVKAEMDTLRAAHAETKRALDQAHAATHAAAAERDSLRQQVAVLDEQKRRRDAQDAAIAAAEEQKRADLARDEERRRVTAMVRDGKVPPPARP